MYYNFEQARAQVNKKLADLGIDPLGIADAREYGIVDDMTMTGIDDVVREIHDEEYSIRCENKIAQERGDFDHLTDYDS